MRMTFPKNAATTWTRPPGRPSQQETLTGRRGRASEAKLGRRRGAPWGVSGKGRWREGLGRLRNGGWRGRKSNRRSCRGGRRGRGACWHHQPSTNAAALAQRPSRRQRLPATAKSQALAPSAFLARSHRLSPPPTEEGGSRAGRGRTLSEIDNSPRSVGARGLRAGRKRSTEAPRRQHARTVPGKRGARRRPAEPGRQSEGGDRRCHGRGSVLTAEPTRSLQGP